MKQIGHLWVDESVIVVPAVPSMRAILQSMAEEFKERIFIPCNENQQRLKQVE